ncbi:hypothetical protein K0T92_16740 [Paenibacillus oenotherae]|uniref:Uncharacterized protein n=1 Tax=Paenibacillus oenotherae TaxID=1435645 RepID=A0ABS7DA52_9BACL|nr:hypothetical protein [Paenibacillus oenotherae]MBW7476382.1 hypothetical protein [Paenibacillus oenotherae]
MRITANSCVTTGFISFWHAEERMPAKVQAFRLICPYLLITRDYSCIFAGFLPDGAPFGQNSCAFAGILPDEAPAFSQAFCLMKLLRFRRLSTLTAAFLAARADSIR